MGSGEPVAGPFAFVPVGGGPVDRLEHRCGLKRDDVRDPAREAVAFAVLAWLPLLVIGVVQRLVSGAWDPLLGRFEVHVRALVAAPLIFGATHIIGERARHGIDYLTEHAIVPEAQWSALRRLRERTEALRDAWAAEAVLVALSLSLSLLGDGTVRGAPPLRFWNEFVSLPLFRYVVGRMLWRWMLWAFFLWRLSRFDLRLMASHPDRLGGLGPLVGPSSSFGMVVMAQSAATAATWASLVVHAGLPLTALQDEVWALLALLTLIAVLPLLSFMGPLRRLARRGEVTFGGLAARYCTDFERKWIGARPEDLLGTSDLQSLADLGNSFEVVVGLRAVPVPGRLLLRLLVSGALPMVPLLLTEVPMAVLLQRVVKAALA
jgi:hypothetical protein